MLTTLPWENLLKTKLTLLHTSEITPGPCGVCLRRWSHRHYITSPNLRSFNLGHKVSFSDRASPVFTDLPIDQPVLTAPFRTLWETAIPSDLSVSIFSFCPSAFLPHWPNEPHAWVELFHLQPGVSFFNFFLPFNNTTWPAKNPTQSLRSSPHLLYRVVPDHLIRIHSFLTQLYTSLTTPYKFNFYFIAN